MKTIPTMSDLEREDRESRRRCRAVSREPAAHLTPEQQRESARWWRRQARSQWSPTDQAFFALQQLPDVEYVKMTFGETWSWGKPMFSIDLRLKNGVRHLVSGLPLRYVLDEALAKVRAER